MNALPKYLYARRNTIVMRNEHIGTRRYTRLRQRRQCGYYQRSTEWVTRAVRLDNSVRQRRPKQQQCRRYRFSPVSRDVWLNMCILAEVISAVEYEPSGRYLATGTKGGRVSIFCREEVTSCVSSHSGRTFILSYLCRKTNVSRHENRCMHPLWNFRVIQQNLII